MSYDILIIGGGVIGASCAFECAKKGLRVALVDPRACGSGASGSSAAMIELQIDAHRGLPFFPLAKLSHQRFSTLPQELADVTGRDIRYESCGIYQLALSPSDALFLSNEVQRQIQLGLKAQWVDQDQLQTDLPILNPVHFGAAFFQEDGQVDGEQFTATLIDAAKKKGAMVFDQTKSVNLLLDRDHVIGVKTPDQTWLADTVVVAAGAWTDQVLSPLGITLGIQPIRGQLLVYDTPQRFLKSPLYTRDSGYITPKSTYTLVGTTVEFVGFDENTTEKARLDLQKTAVHLIPNFSRKHIRGVSAGLRPGSPDGLPFIGALASHNNVFIASAHYRNGILLAPITGQLIAELITGQQPSLDLEPFSPKRHQTSLMDI